MGARDGMGDGMGMGWINGLISAAMWMLMALAQGFTGASLI